MSAVAAPIVPTAALSGRLRPAIDIGQCVVLEDVSWQAYELIGEALRERANIRLSYDRGRLEIMTLSPEHERLRSLLGYLVQVFAEETDVRIASFGSTTYKRDVLDRGLEPDQCYYIGNLARVRGLRRIDLSRDPPPDLAIEVDVTHSSVNRMSIYAALGVHELWRLENDTVRAYLFRDGRYEPTQNSPAFPHVRLSGLVPLLQVGFDQDDTSMIRAARVWVRGLPPNP